MYDVNIYYYREAEFNLDQMREAMSIMEGTHNFKAFCSRMGHFHHGKLEGSDKYISIVSCF